jgi:uncharacterized iron-regulated membrane protein
MSSSSDARRRRLWRNVHLWVGLGLAALLVPVSLSGALLVWHDHLDALVHPARYAVIAGDALAPAALIDKGVTALGHGHEPFGLRMPKDAGWPVTVMAREQRRGERAGRQRLLTVYLDPPTGRVLDVVDFRDSLIGFLHRLHENLTIPELSGRAIVGWSGVAMLALALSGIYLWWPRNAPFLRGLRWRRAATLSFNLHHLLGFWVALPLAVVSATGVYLGFPQQGRQLLSAVAPMTPQQRGGFAAPPLRDRRLDADRVLALALAAAPDARPAAIFLPSQQNGSWRVQLRHGGSETLATVLVDDRTGAAMTVTPRSGDRVQQWIRWLHEGSHSGPIWRIVVFICGLLPTVFAITGLMIWLHSRQARIDYGPPRGCRRSVPPSEGAATGRTR